MNELRAWPPVACARLRARRLAVCDLSHRLDREDEGGAAQSWPADTWRPIPGKPPIDHAFRSRDAEGRRRATRPMPARSPSCGGATAAT